MATRGTRTDWLLFVAAGVMWGSSYLFIKIGVETNLKRKGSCELVMTWPKVGAASGESKMPDNSGRCSWTITVPAELPGDSEANVLITVRKNGSTVRTLTRDFKVR